MHSIDCFLICQTAIIIPFVYMVYRAWTLSHELHDSNLRLITLSCALQKVEYTTGKPWYTSTGTPNKCEGSEWLFTHYKDKLNSATDRAIARRHRRR
jgi:hypothetical protein